METTTSSPNAVASPHPQRRRNRWLLWIGRILLGLLALIVLLAGSGAAYEAIMAPGDARRYPPPGQLVDVGGHRLHLHCVGQGSPTVVLDAGLVRVLSRLGCGSAPGGYVDARLRIRPSRPRLERTWPVAAQPAAVCGRAAHAPDEVRGKGALCSRRALHLGQDGTSLREPAPERGCRHGARRRAT